MAYVKKLFNDNFLHYASYVIKDRAIPDIEDGLKPVQRRILHTLFEADDGKFHKVANIVGSCMKYHPHGDASIYSALVVLANKELFIDRQGNFGNLFTGDEASAARYIECRATPLAKEVLYNPKITEYVDSYDGRNKEPVVFPAKLPIVLILGAEGIAVGMSTKIMPHNPLEVIAAEIACLKGKKFSLYPDFPTGGIADVSEYADGMGKIRVRAKLDLSDPKRIVIRELPFGTTTESLIGSVEAAAKAGRLKIASISDFTTSQVEIEIRLQRGVYAEDILDALYAFTECEVSISCNLLIIKEDLPVQMKVSEVVRHHADRLLALLEAELKIREKELLDEIHARTLERIFIEERVYKAIETKKTQEAVQKAVIDGLAPFKKEIRREVTLDDVERLLKIPIRRISLYDIEKAKDEMTRLNAELKDVRNHLANLVDYGIDFLQGVSKKLGRAWARKTELSSFTRVDVREAARRDITLRYDRQTGYLGTSVSTGESLFQVSPYDKILVVRRSGIWSVVPVPERLFVDQGMLYAAIADKEALASQPFSLVYRDGVSTYPYIKRFKIEAWIMNKDYQLLPEGAETLWFGMGPSGSFSLKYAPKPRLKIRSEKFRIEDFDVKGIKANGVRLALRDVLSAEGPSPIFGAPAPELFPSREEDEPEPDAGAPAPKKDNPGSAENSPRKKAPATKSASAEGKQLRGGAKKPPLSPAKSARTAKKPKEKSKGAALTEKNAKESGSSAPSSKTRPPRPKKNASAKGVPKGGLLAKAERLSDAGNSRKAAAGKGGTKKTRKESTDKELPRSGKRK